jgi:Response regulators consisting of a CheY-like receiver domain and a winged-helix DNA-binding domain
MLLNFVREVLEESHYEVIGAGTGEQGLQATRDNQPDLVILDHALPDLSGEEVREKLARDTQTASIPVIYMSGFAESQDAQSRPPNVVGFLSKPFTADLLLNAIEEHVPRATAGNTEPGNESDTAVVSEFANVIGPETQSPEVEASGSPLWGENPSLAAHTELDSGFVPPPEQRSNSESNLDLASSPDVFFAGDTNFFSLNWALQTIGREKLTGVLRCFWSKADLELFARDGKVLLVTTRDPELYCSEAPITLVNIDAGRVAEARSEQSQTGCPLFITLAREDLIIRDAALQLVQHYGQKVFAQLWGTSRVRFAFEQVSRFPDFVSEAGPGDDVDQWTLAAVRFVQLQDVAEKVSHDPNWIPAYTRDGFERVQNLRLTVAEAQFASQFNGNRSIAQIARNLRLDMKVVKLTLFRFLALEIVECWPPAPVEEIEHSGLLKRLGRKIGLAE